MDKHEVDRLFKKAIDDSADFYSATALESKYKIWNTIVNQKKNNKTILIRLLAAACILLLFCTSYFAFIYMKSKKDNQFLKNQYVLIDRNLRESAKTITYQNNYIRGIIQSKTEDQEPITPKIIYKTNIQTIQTRDTVYKEKIVYIRENPLEKKEVQPVHQIPEQKDTIILNRSLIITNISPNKSSGKTAKFKISFGGSKSKVNDDALALSTRL